MNRAQILAVIVVSLDAGFAFLTTQPDGTFSQFTKIVFGFISVVFTVVALYLRPSLPGQTS